jgi:hypothetical protein
MTQYVYRTTDTVKCPVCGAEPGQDCHLQSGQWAGYGDKKRYHIDRIDPTSEPVGVVDETVRPDDPFIYMTPLS